MMRTTTLRPLLRLTTFTLVPKGSERWAAVIAAGFMRSPEAVLDVSAYQEARPHCAEAVERPRPRRALAARAAAVRCDFFIVWGFSLWSDGSRLCTE